MLRNVRIFAGQYNATFTPLTTGYNGCTNCKAIRFVLRNEMQTNVLETVKDKGFP